LRGLGCGILRAAIAGSRRHPEVSGAPEERMDAAAMGYAPRRRRLAEASAEESGEVAPTASLTIRVDFGPFGSLGPGKIALMELISKHGSMAAAGKEMGMSYRRAWLLVDEINQMFREPLVEKHMGGSGGGGARLTKLGRDVVGRYRAIEGAAATATAADLRALKSSLPAKPPIRARDTG
jgi:molybdate transport system regulatory protein